jgi:hypothetical protein
MLREREDLDPWTAGNGQLSSRYIITVLYHYIYLGILLAPIRSLAQSQAFSSHNG